MEEFSFHQSQLGLKIGRDRGGVQPHHLTKMFRIFGLQRLLRGMALAIDAWEEHEAHSGGHSPMNGRIAVAGKGIVVEVTMSVNHGRGTILF